MEMMTVAYCCFSATPVNWSIWLSPNRRCQFDDAEIRFRILQCHCDSIAAIPETLGMPGGQPALMLARVLAASVARHFHFFPMSIVMSNHVLVPWFHPLKPKPAPRAANRGLSLGACRGWASTVPVAQGKQNAIESIHLAPEFGVALLQCFLWYADRSSCIHHHTPFKIHFCS